MGNAINVKAVSHARRNNGFKFFMALVGTLATRPTAATRDAVDMGVNGKDGRAKGVEEDALRNLVRNPRERQKIARRLAVVLSAEGG
jgi:hypothetical protein